MLGRRFVIPLIVIGSVAAGGVAGAVLGVPSLSGASATGTSVTSTSIAGKHGHFKGGLRGGAMGGRFEAAATALHLTPAQLKQKLSDGKTTIADVAKQQNVPINDVIDAIAAADRKAIENWVNTPLAGPFAGGSGAANGAVPNNGNAPNIGGLGKGLGRFGGFGGLNEIAKALGTTPQQLIQDLMSGKSIKSIAQANHVDINKLIDDAVKAASDRIDKAEAAGKITADQATQAKSMLRDAITKIVNGQLPSFGGKGGFHLPFGGGSSTP
jgi:hypothetical protein